MRVFFFIRKYCYRHEGGQYIRAVYNRVDVVELKETITTIQDHILKQSRYKYWDSMVSI